MMIADDFAVIARNHARLFASSSNRKNANDPIEHPDEITEIIARPSPLETFTDEEIRNLLAALTLVPNEILFA
jgi:hypothetical protein